MNLETEKLKTRLAELDKFLASREHAAYKSARLQEITDTKERILMTPPINQDNIATQLLAFGELGCLEEMLTSFETARVILKKEVDEMIDRDNQNAGNTKV